MKRGREDIEGLQLIENFLTEDEEAQLMRLIDSSPWDRSISRRTQHYGFRYDYASKHAQDPAPPIPDRARGLRGIWITQNISKMALYPFRSMPNMIWISQEAMNPSSSALVLHGDARYQWRHGIEKRKEGVVDI